MEQKIISLNKGIRRTPSVGEEGELIDCVNLVVKDGELRNAPVATDLGNSVNDGELIIYVHKVDSSGDTQTNYIRKNSENKIIYGNNLSIASLDSGEEIQSIQSLGNILLISTSTMLRMYLWNVDKYEDYSLFGMKPLDITFALNGQFVRKRATTVNVTKAERVSSDTDILKKTLTGAWVAREDGDQHTIPAAKDDFITFDSENLLESGKTYRVEYVDESGEPITPVSPQYQSGTGKLYCDAIKEKYGIDWFDYGLWKEGNNTDTPDVKGDAAWDSEFVFNVPEGMSVKKMIINCIFAMYTTVNVSIYEITEKQKSKYAIDTEDDKAINAVYAAANKFVSEEYLGENKFIFPFLVRTAVRLIDGTHILPSAPMLMIPSDGVEPKLSVIIEEGSTVDTFKAPTVTSAIACDLYYALSGNDTLTNLKQMKSIVDSVEIAVSEPIRRFKQNPTQAELKESLSVVDYKDAYGYYMVDGEEDDSRKVKRRSRKSEEIRYGKSIISEYEISLPENTNINEEIEKISTFYVIKRIPIDKLVGTDYVKVDIESGTLSSLTARQTISDNTTSLKRTLPKILFPYNNRIAMANYAQYAFDGYALYMMAAAEETRELYLAEAVVNINKNGRLVRTNSSGDCVIYGNDFIWYYYPDSDAQRVEIYIYKGTFTMSGFKVTNTYKKTFTLKEHPFLKGAYAFNNFRSIQGESESVNDAEVKQMLNADKDVKNVLVVENGIMQSCVNNPLVIEDSLTSDIGKGIIKALSTTTKALSEGQFGSFPLVVFTDEGIWAVSISAEGKFQGVQPVSRDCLLEDTKPLQTDNSIIFATTGGLNVLSGSTVEDISDSFEGAVEGADIAIGLITDYDTIINTETESFNEELSGSEMVWDYDNKVIHLFTEKNHYIKDVKGGEWSRSSETRPNAIIPSYPYTIMQKGDKLVQYKRSNDNTTQRKGFVLTRDICFGAPLTMKVLNEVKVLKRMMASSSSIKVATFVSNDRIKWYRLRSLKSHSWKWYRFAIYTNMCDVDTVSGVVCMTEERRKGRLR